jgi:hypothetical protein
MESWSFPNWFARSSPFLVALVALVGLGLSFFILVLPAAGGNLADRADVSAAIATMFALIAAIVAVSAAVWVTTSNYRAEQNAKKDIPRIRATLQSIMYKGALDQRITPNIFEMEREAVSEFVSSTTSWGLRKWVAMRTPPATGTPDPWNGFFLRTTSLLLACEPPEDRHAILTSASALDGLLGTLEKRDIKTIITLAGDLTGDIGTPAAVSLGDRDVLLSSVAAVYGESDRDQTPWKFRHLKQKGVNDPNVDMFVAVFDDDTEALKASLEAGADTSVTDKQVLAAHEAELADFRPRPS